MNNNDLFIISAANEYFKAFVGAIHENYLYAKHNRLIMDKLQQVSEGKIKRLIINVSPRSGKSLLSSQLLPAWFLGKYPDKNIICTTYGQELADNFGRQVRNTLKDPKYQAIFPGTVLADDSSSIKKFATTKGGQYIAVGSGGSLTGHGADLIIIDDPIKNRADANSPRIRNNVIDWFKSTLYTRLSPTGTIIILQTRWREDDLSGYLLEHEPENWDVIKIPAINEKGESYWPERWSVDKINDIKKTVGSYEFSALYQQSPSPAEGGMFERRWFEVVQAIPASAQRVRYWDRAATVKTSGNDPDWTVGLKMAKDKDGILYVENIVRFRGSSLDVEKAIVNTAAQDGFKCKIGLEQDPGQAGKMEVEYLIRKLQGFIVSSHKVTKDKVTRASPVASQAEAGNIKVLRGDWNAAFFEELEMFPFGAKDDMIDGLSGSFGMLVTQGLDYSLFTRM